MTHQLINTDNYLLVVDDSEIKERDWVITTISEIDIYNVLEKFRNDCDVIYCKKIIAHLPLNNSPILEGVDLLPPLEDEAESLSLKSVNKRGYTTDDYQDGFEDGYNKAKEKYKYTEEDMKKAINLAYVSGGGGDKQKEEIVSLLKDLKSKNETQI